jgi:putative intracellular protease/amidase
MPTMSTPLWMTCSATSRLTGYAWSEEVLADIAKDVPYNAGQTMKDRGALYEKALLPFVSNAVADGRLVTGQNPGPAKAASRQVAPLL